MFQLLNTVALSHMWVLSTWNTAKGTGQLDFQFPHDFGQGGFRFLQYHGVKHSSCTICSREIVRNTIYWTSPSTSGTKLYILITSASITCTLKFVRLCLKWPRKIGVISQRCLGYSAIATSAASNWLNIFFFLSLMLLAHPGSEWIPFNIVLPRGPRLAA